MLMSAVPEPAIAALAAAAQGIKVQNDEKDARKVENKKNITEIASRFPRKEYVGIWSV
jgi:hypothetical protein